jgi:hypothetical protein
MYNKFILQVYAIPKIKQKNVCIQGYFRISYYVIKSGSVHVKFTTLPKMDSRSLVELRWYKQQLPRYLHRYKILFESCLHQLCTKH